MAAQHKNWAVDANGDIVAGVEVTVRDNAGNLATLYSDIAGTALANPFNGEADGSFEFYTEPGFYTIEVGSDPTLSTYPLHLLDARRWTPDADGEGTPSHDLALGGVGTSAIVSEMGRVGVGPAAGKLYFAGDEVTVTSGTEPLVVVASGQSNMQGAAQNGAGGTYRVDSAVKCWENTAGEFQVADLENNAYYTTTGNPYGNGNQNIGVSFAHRLHAQTGRDVYVIVAAQGGQSIDEWVGSGAASTIYDGMETVIEAQLTALGKTQIDFFLWHHGESDADEDTGVYRRKLGTLIEQLRAEPWFASDTPFIAGEACPDWSVTDRRDYMNAEVGTLLDRNDPYLFVASADGLSGDDDLAYDEVHFDNASIDELGYNRYWRAMWGASDDIAVTTSATATTGLSVTRGKYADREYSNDQFVNQDMLSVTKPNTQFTRISAPQSYMELESAGGNGVFNFIGKLLRPNTTGVTDLGASNLTFKSLYLSSSLVQPNASDLNIIVNGINLFGFRSDGTVRQRGSSFAFFDERADGYNVQNFSASDGSLRGQIVMTYTTSGATFRLGVANSSGTIQNVMRVDEDGEVRFPLGYTDFTTTNVPNAVLMPDGGIRRSTTAGVETSIASAPTRTGQFAVVGGVGYMATGTASAADWKQITN